MDASLAWLVHLPCASSGRFPALRLTCSTASGAHASLLKNLRGPASTDARSHRRRPNLECQVGVRRRRRAILDPGEDSKMLREQSETLGTRPILRNYLEHLACRCCRSPVDVTQRAPFCPTGAPPHLIPAGSGLRGSCAQRLISHGSCLPGEFASFDSPARVW